MVADPLQFFFLLTLRARARWAVYFFVTSGPIMLRPSNLLRASRSRYLALFVVGILLACGLILLCFFRARSASQCLIVFYFQLSPLIYFFSLARSVFLWSRGQFFLRSIPSQVRM